MYSLVCKGITLFQAKPACDSVFRGQYQLALKRVTTGIVCMVTRSQDNGWKDECAMPRGQYHSGKFYCVPARLSSPRHISYVINDGA